MLCLAEGLGGVEWAQLGCFKPGQCSVPGQRGALVGSCPEELLYCLVRWVGQQMNPCPQPLLGAKVGSVPAWELGEISLQIHGCWVSKDEKFTKQKRKGGVLQAQGIDG